MTDTIAPCRLNVAGNVADMSAFMPSRPATHRRHCGVAAVSGRRVPLTEVAMPGDDDEPVTGRGEQIQAAEREAAKRRLLAEAEAERIPAEEISRAVPDRRWRRDQP
ncbi:hypothetical protein ACFO0M_02605 [Micromonospora mangrovi]|uniref:Uncharacterized protein n=2 Tax=Micromonospora TaxID=1873 RepID=A0AAU8H4Z9_9ACTN